LEQCLETKYRVFFSKKYVGQVQPLGSLLFIPENPTWNDFGFQVRAKLIIKSHDSDRNLSLGAYVLPLEAEDGSKVASSFYDWVAKLDNDVHSGLLVPPEADSHNFLTLLSDDAEYRKLGEWSKSLGERLSILLTANDINLARVNNSVPAKKIELATDTEAFTLGVMRSSSAYRAYSKGARYVSREILPWIEDARTDLRVQVLLNGFKTEHKVAFTFEDKQKPSLVSDRIHVLIGRNGTGKSQLLRQIVGSIALRADGTSDDVFLDDSNAKYGPDVVSVATIPNALLVFSSDAEAPFPSRTRLDTPLDYSYFGLATKQSTEDESELDQASLGQALRNLIRDDSKLQEKSRFQTFRDVLAPVLDLTELHLPLKKSSVAIKKLLGVRTDSAGYHWLSIARVPKGEQQTLHLASGIDTKRDLAFIDDDGNEYPPSSGQRVYLRFAAQALSVIAQGSMIILDEPETHLHPNFVSEFMTLLHQILEATNSIALIATHSPYVVREVPSMCVHVVRVEGNVPEIGSVHLKTLGASVSSISDAVFFDSTAARFHHLIAKELAKQMKEVVGTEAQRVAWIIRNYGGELNTEMLSAIRFEMEQDRNKNKLQGGDDALDIT
jgi:predicted ATPase